MAAASLTADASRCVNQGSLPGRVYLPPGALHLPPPSICLSLSRVYLHLRPGSRAASRRLCGRHEQVAARERDPFLGQRSGATRAARQVWRRSQGYCRLIVNTNDFCARFVTRHHSVASNPSFARGIPRSSWSRSGQSNSALSLPKLELSANLRANLFTWTICATGRLIRAQAANLELLLLLLLHPNGAQVN